MGTILFTHRIVCELPAIAHEIPKLTNICGRDKAAGNQSVLEDICDPFGIFFVGLLAPNCFHIFGVSKNNLARGFQCVVNRNPVFTRGFHANIFAVVFSKPGGTTTQVAGKGREAFLLVGGHTLVICSCDTGDNKVFVDIHSTANWINNFKHSTSPQRYFEETGRDWTLTERVK